jgi:hypothetical protein
MRAARGAESSDVGALLSADASGLGGLAKGLGTGGCRMRGIAARHFSRSLVA